MKNLKYFPFERNKYFFGKLLTVGDFETEQKYFNDKRRLINRFLHGTGVVCGMNVVRVDDMAISVEMGVALDFSGREIFIDTPVIKKLSMIEGFDSGEKEDSSYLYLCIEYAEHEKEPVHSITSTNARSSDELQYNKYAEGYRLFLTSQEPENDGFTTARFYLDTKTVYWGNGLRIKQTVPKYITSSDEFTIGVEVEKMGQQQPISFEYELDLTCVKADGKEKLKVTFNEKDFAPAGKYFINYRVKSMAVNNTEGIMSVNAGSFKLFVGEKQVSAEPVCKNITNIIEGNAKKEIMNRYYHTAMEDIIKNTYQQSIYLAKINIIKAGSTYVIESVEGMPFRQYVFNNSLASVLGDIEISELENLHNHYNVSGSEKTGDLSRGFGGNQPAIATGTEVIDLGIGGKEGQRFFSGEISHNLGLGLVFITLGEAYQLSDDSPVLFGDTDVFTDTKDMAPVQLAAKADVTKGTFVIGAKMKAASNARRLKVNWMAVRDPKESVHDVEVKKLFVKPDMANVDVREACYFEAIFTNVTDKRVKWHVKEKDGGTINENGMYTAPNVAGVYEIIVESVVQPDLKASAYVVVRDNAPKNVV